MQEIQAVSKTIEITKEAGRLASPKFLRVVGASSSALWFRMSDRVLCSRKHEGLLALS